MIAPKPWPWNNVRPILWGNKMTVCISAMCTDGDANSIVMASDHMISMGGYTGSDDAALKVDPLYFHWFSQFAANDVSAILPIYDLITRDNRSEKSLDNVIDVSNMCKRAYQAGRLERIQDEVLAEYGLTWKEFKEHGSSRLDARDFQVLTERVRGFDLSFEMLVAGFDARGAPHIFTVGNPGTVNYYDKLGFWAIGSGQPNALGSLFASGFKIELPIEICVAHVLSAKFSAESAQGVGKSTFLVIYNSKDELHYLPTPLHEKIKKEWKGLPRIPHKSLAKIKESLKKAKTS